MGEAVGHFHPKGKPPSEHTLRILEEARQSLPFADKRDFKPWEPIRTEFSYKYLESDIRSLADATNFKVIDQFYDSRRHFTSSLWQVCKESAADREANGKG